MQICEADHHAQQMARLDALMMQDAADPLNEAEKIIKNINPKYPRMDSKHWHKNLDGSKWQLPYPSPKKWKLEDEAIRYNAK